MAAERPPIPRSEFEEPGSGASDDATDVHFEYQIGQLVSHRRYPYRGVIAGCDPHCRADDNWYQGNRTQPDRDQPWYHVLVHGSHHTTYVAEENLDDDPGQEQVIHPLAKKLFAHYTRAGYIPAEDAAFPDLWD